VKQNHLNAGGVYSLLLALLMLISTYSHASESKPLVLGLSPFISTVSLFERLSPLSQYLSEKLGREVLIQTDRDLQELMRRIHQREYDLLLATPVFALRAIDGGHYSAGVITTQRVQPVLMVEGSSLIQHPRQLANKRVALPPHASLVSSLAERWFLSRGLTRDELPEFINFNSNNAAYQATLNGDIEAAFVADFAVTQLRKKLPILKIIDSAEPLPGNSILFANNIDDSLKEQLIALLIALEESPQGREILNRISFPPFRKADAGEYEVIRPYLPAMQIQLQ
jgi:ABC-type phosphate/phosphonate transport system substrate-binding protein